ncbi:MAG: sigma-70 family RNA polymerase sigma factor [Hydrogenophaga sp.]|uniref:sigma-70 family RNA polymerase sigma factor n=1 Tax=Hydrogenophaga sp. TaxID=1904254 RepID=UPI001DEA3F63|nr:sigma-70 family RNA polymerase sigma factor [Hydrogenophaga sp.]MBX3610502.1 sigma-70 family RNA polymerase sigma factor [Hydrogenophaga sp.]
MEEVDPPKLLDADRRSLLRAATRLVGSFEAEDVVQDAYVRALEADGLTLNTTQAWLRTVVRNLAIDRWRRREWMTQWTTQLAFDETHRWEAPSAEEDASLEQEAAQVVRRLARLLTPVEGAALLLHEVFDVEHAEIARGAGRSEAANRQQLKRALRRLRQKDDASPETDGGNEQVIRAYLHSLRTCDPGILWGMLREPPIRAFAGAPTRMAASGHATMPSTSIGGLVQMGGQLGLILSLDGVRLCVVPLGICARRELDDVTG